MNSTLNRLEQCVAIYMFINETHNSKKVSFVHIVVYSMFPLLVHGIYIYIYIYIYSNDL